MKRLTRDLLLLREQFLLRLMQWVQKHDGGDQSSLVWLDRKLSDVRVRVEKGK